MSRRDRGDRSRYEDDEPPRLRRGDYEERSRGETPRERETKKSKGDSNLNEYFIDGKGINREVLQREICYFLGPEAYSKPSVYKGIDGYMIKAVRPFTPEMLRDLIRLSEKFNQENNELKSKRGRGIPYADSRTAKIQDPEDVDMDDSEDDDPRPSRNPRPPRGERDPYDTKITREFEAPYPRGTGPYDSGSTRPGPDPNTHFGYPASGNPYPPSAYGAPYDSNQRGYPVNYPPEPAYPTSGYPPSSGPGNPSSYQYGIDPSNIPGEPYGKPGIYSPPTGRDPRAEPPRYPTRDPYEGRGERERYPPEPNYPPSAGRGGFPPGPGYGVEPRSTYPKDPYEYPKNLRGDPYKAQRLEEEPRRRVEEESRRQRAYQ